MIPGFPEFTQFPTQSQLLNQRENKRSIFDCAPQGVIANNGARFTQKALAFSRIKRCSHHEASANGLVMQGVISPHNSQGASKLLINQTSAFKRRPCLLPLLVAEGGGINYCSRLAFVYPICFLSFIPPVFLLLCFIRFLANVDALFLNRRSIHSSNHQLVRPGHILEEHTPTYQRSWWL